MLWRGRETGRWLEANCLFYSPNSRNRKTCRCLLQPTRSQAQTYFCSSEGSVRSEHWAAVSPRISFLSLISERISWRWNCALNMLQTRLNINESPALLFGCTGPIWIGFFAHWTNQTTRAVIRRRDPHPPVCTVRRLRPRSLNVAQSPLSSLFMLRGNPPQINNTSPQSPRLLMRRDSFSTRSWTLLQEDKECWRLGNTEYITASCIIHARCWDCGTLCSSSHKGKLPILKWAIIYRPSLPDI